MLTERILPRNKYRRKLPEKITPELTYEEWKEGYHADLAIMSGETMASISFLERDLKKKSHEIGELIVKIVSEKNHLKWLNDKLDDIEKEEQA